MARHQAGEKYNNLTLISIDREHKGKWICQCDCGVITSKTLSNVVSGKTKSCGCMRSEISANHCRELNSQRREKYNNQIIGQKYGFLTVLSLDAEKTEETGRTYFKCSCSCGCNSIITVRRDSLTSGNTTSCGTNRSRGELKILEILENSNLSFCQQICFEDLAYIRKLKFDFGILENEKVICLIEFQGEQHYTSSDFFGGEKNYEKQKIRDEMKREYCKNNNIPLIEIPYTDLKILNEEYLLNKINLYL